MASLFKKVLFVITVFSIFHVSAQKATAQIIPARTIYVKVSSIVSGAQSWHYKTRTSAGVYCDDVLYGVNDWVDNVDFSATTSNCWIKSFVLDNTNPSTNFTWNFLGYATTSELDHLVTSSNYVAAWTCSYSMCRYWEPYTHEAGCAWTLQGNYNPNSINSITAWIKSLPSDTFVLFNESTGPVNPPYYCD